MKKKYNNKNFLQSMKSAVENILKKAQREIDVENPEYDVYDRMDQWQEEMEERGVPVGEEQGEGGLSQGVIDKLFEIAAESGVRTEQFPMLESIIDSINEEVINGWKGEREAISEIKKYIDNIAKATEPQAYPTEEVQTEVMTEPEEKNSLEQPLQPNDIDPTESFDQDEVPSEEEGQEYEEEVEEDEREVIEEFIAEEEEDNIPLSQEYISTDPADYDPEKDRKYLRKALEEGDPAYMNKPHIINWANNFLHTSQSDAIEDVYGKEQLVTSSIFDKYLSMTVRFIQSSYSNMGISTLVSKADILGSFYMNLKNALGVWYRTRSTDESVSEMRDNRFVVMFRGVNKDKALLDKVLPDVFEALESEAEELLSQLNEMNERYGKPQQNKLYAPSWAKIAKDSPYAGRIWAKLNELILEQNPELLKAVLAYASYLTRDQFVRQESGDKIVPSIVDEEGKEVPPEDLGGETSEKIHDNQLVDWKEARPSLNRMANHIRDFGQDLWIHLSEGTDNPKAYQRFDAIRLKLALVNEQSESLFSDEKMDLNIKPGSVSNDNGKVFWNTVDTNVNVETDKGNQEMSYDSSFKDIVSPEVFQSQYIILQKMKLDIKKYYGVLGSPDELTDDHINRIQRALLTKPEYQTDVMAPFIQDPKFIRMAVYSNPEKELNKAQKKKPKRFEESFNTIWPHVIADAVFAVAKKESQLQNTEFENEGQKMMAIDEFKRARQNLVSIIGVHKNILQAHQKTKVGVVNKKLTALLRSLGVIAETEKVTNREALYWILGLKEIPQEFKDPFVQQKYASMSLVYNRMMSKIGRLIDLNSRLRKISSTDTVEDQIKNIYRRTMIELSHIARM